MGKVFIIEYECAECCRGVGMCVRALFTGYAKENLCYMNMIFRFANDLPTKQQFYKEKVFIVFKKKILT